MTGAPALEITSFAALDDAARDRHWPAVVEIFFASARPRAFEGDADRQAFLDRWTGYYRSSEPEHVLLAIEPAGRLAGYLMGCLDSRGAARLYRDLAHYALFEDCFEAYPAHLHVNCRPDARNRGVGTRLVQAFAEICAGAGLPGVHIVTAAGAGNVRFYERCGFDVTVRRPWHGRDLLFMARKL